MVHNAAANPAGSTGPVMLVNFIKVTDVDGTERYVNPLCIVEIEKSFNSVEVLNDQGEFTGEFRQEEQTFVQTMRNSFTVPMSMDVFVGVLNGAM